MDVKAKLESMGLALPAVSGPFGAYVPAKRAGDSVFVAGQLPMRDGSLVAFGRVPESATVDEARDAARQCVVNALAAVEGAVEGGLSVLSGVARVSVFVSSTGDFFDQPKVADAASELLLELFGEAGKHARSAVGVASLPRDAAVEVEVTFTCAAPTPAT